MKFFLSIFFILFLFIRTLPASDVRPYPVEEIEPSEVVEYLVRLNNGDLISGNILDVVEDEEYGAGIEMRTEIGTAIIYADQIAAVWPVEDYYRHSHRIFLLPTAYPIGDDHFIGNFEIFMVYAGIGFWDYVSVTAGRTFVPGIPSGDQISVFNAKWSIYSMQFNEYLQEIAFAAGANLTFLNHDNKFVHGYGTATVDFGRTVLTGTLFYKTGADQIIDFHLQNYTHTFLYTNGSWGLGAGMDVKLSDRRDLRFIGEIWNSDFAMPTNSGVLLGFRLNNERFATDFGIAVFTQPFAAPFVSFVWTPF